VGMDRLPWTLHEFLPAIGDVIQGRALQGILGGLFLFDWQELDPGNVYLGNAVYPGVHILQGCDPSDAPARKKDFEEFFRCSESSAEAKDMQAKLRQRGCTQEAAIELLRTAANTDPVTSRCFLCSGTSLRRRLTPRRPDCGNPAITK
jgi:hypothetical protein